MPTPFPGMNPYLEQDDVWHDFHERFSPLVAELLAAQVRPAYIVKIDEHVYLHELSADERLLLGKGDVTVAQLRPGEGLSSGAAIATAPFYATLPTPVDVARESFVEIRDRKSRSLITVIELLSPSNKKIGGDRDQFLAKRRKILASGVHLVEIDLLRGGPRMPFEDLPDCDYYVMVSRAEERPHVGVWPIRLREAMPRIPVPLRSPDPDARLDLQPIIHRLYDAAAYEDYIYSGSPQPPLHPDDAAWARQLIPTSS